MPIDYIHCPSPAFVPDESLLRKNLELIAGVKRSAGIETILALKGFALELVCILAFGEKPKIQTSS